MKQEGQALSGIPKTTGELKRPDKCRQQALSTQYTGALLIVKSLLRKATQENNRSGLGDPSMCNAAISCKQPQVWDKRRSTALLPGHSL